MQVTVNLPEETYQQAIRLAQLTSRNVADVLADALELSLSPLGIPKEPAVPVSRSSNEEVLALTNLQMDAADDARLSYLLHQQQAGELSAEGRIELAQLMYVYQEGLLRKSLALAEAVKRGLMQPLS